MGAGPAGRAIGRITVQAAPFVDHRQRQDRYQPDLLHGGRPVRTVGPKPAQQKSGRGLACLPLKVFEAVSFEPLRQVSARLDEIDGARTSHDRSGWAGLPARGSHDHIQEASPRRLPAMLSHGPVSTLAWKEAPGQVLGGRVREYLRSVARDEWRAGGSARNGGLGRSRGCRARGTAHTHTVLGLPAGWSESITGGPTLLDSLFAFRVARPAPLRVACLVRPRCGLSACHSALMISTSLTVVAVVAANPSNLSPYHLSHGPAGRPSAGEPSADPSGKKVPPPPPSISGKLLNKNNDCSGHPKSPKTTGTTHSVSKTRNKNNQFLRSSPKLPRSKAKFGYG